MQFHDSQRGLPRVGYRRRRAVRTSARRGLAAIEVVMVTAAIIPSLLAMLWLGMHAMAAFLSVLGTMLGSPIG